MTFSDGRRGCPVRWWKRLKDIYHQAAPSAVDYRRPASELQAGVASGGGGKSLGQSLDSWLSALLCH